MGATQVGGTSGGGGACGVWGGGRGTEGQVLRTAERPGSKPAGSSGVPPAPDVPSEAQGQAAGSSPGKNDLQGLRAPSCQWVVPTPGTGSLGLISCARPPTGRPRPGTGPASLGEQLTSGTSGCPLPAGWTADRRSCPGNSSGECGFAPAILGPLPCWGSGWGCGLASSSLFPQ